MRHSGSRRGASLIAVVSGIVQIRSQRSDLMLRLHLEAQAQELRAQSARIAYLAYNDSLTGLPNRASMNEKIDEVIRDATVTDVDGALLYLDLDGFKEINDRYGHDAGDSVWRRSDRVFGDVRRQAPRQGIARRFTVAASGMRIVIIGGGFAGVAVAHRLERRLRPDETEIVLLSRENFTLFTPMLPEVCSGALDVRHVVTPIRSQLRRTQFILADFRKLDLPNKAIEYTHTLTGTTDRLSYDHLVLALGSTISTFGLPGVAQHVFALKTLEDAGILRNRLMWLLELADSEPDMTVRRALLRVVVVGGGFTGVEAAGELLDMFKSVLRYFPRIARDDVEVVLVEGGPRLLAGLPVKMGAYSARALGSRGLQIRTGDRVAGVDDRALHLASGARIESRTIVWSAGTGPSPSLAATTLPRDRSGRIATAADMSVAEHRGIWAIGDCSAIPQTDSSSYPATAQHAIREGPVLADNIVAVLRGRPTKPFVYRALGMMASLGGRRAVAQLPGGRVLTGFLAWVLWRSYYLSRLPGLDRKLRVAFDWTLDLLFPRDIAELRVYTRRAQSSAAADAGLAHRDEARPGP